MKLLEQLPQKFGDLPAWARRTFWFRVALWVLVALFAIFGALIYATHDDRANVTAALRAQQEILRAPQSVLVTQSSELFTDYFPGRDEQPSTEMVGSLKDAVVQVRNALIAVEAPTMRIRNTRREYRKSLDALQGVIVSYNPTPENHLALYNASQTTVNIAGDFREEIDGFNGSLWRSLRGLIF